MKIIPFLVAAIIFIAGVLIGTQSEQWFGISGIVWDIGATALAITVGFILLRTIAWAQQDRGVEFER